MSKTALLLAAVAAAALSFLLGLALGRSDLQFEPYDAEKDPDLGRCPMCGEDGVYRQDLEGLR